MALDLATQHCAKNDEDEAIHLTTTLILFINWDITWR